MNQQQPEPRQGNVLCQIADIYKHSIVISIDYSALTKELVMDLILIDGSFIHSSYPTLGSRNIKLSGKILEEQQELHLCMLFSDGTVSEVNIPMVQRESTTAVSVIVGDSLKTAQEKLFPES